MSKDTILVVDDDQGMRTALCDTLSANGYNVLSASNGSEALQLVKSAEISLILSDIQMAPTDGVALMREVRAIDPMKPIILMTAFGTIDQAVASMLDGASHYLVKPFGMPALEALIRRLLPRALPATAIVAEDDKMIRALQMAALVAQSDATVTISGESGTGKELVAREIHAASARRDREFVAINCAAIPENMLEAVLFGHEKGAFTGATKDSPGKFELAQHSTLLLDEITEMELGLQAKLLRVLQEKEVERIGSAKTIDLDVRVIATTNRDLKQEVESGRFREDLYYRLNVFPIQLPSLRERQADIEPLARFLVQKHSRASVPPVFASAALEKLRIHTWPGNVRELENVVQRGLILSGGNDIQPQQLDLPCDSVPAAAAETDLDLHDTLLNKEHTAILTALHATTGNRSAAAEKLGISPRTLRYKLARLRDSGVHVPKSFATAS